MSKEIKVYNTLSQKKEPLVPLEEGRIRMYACGPTVYSSAHLGHARSAVTFDVITRFLRSVGYEVTYVRNFTDIDDKIIAKSIETGTPAHELSEKYIEEYRKDMEALGVEKPDHEPKVTEHVPEILDLIQSLIDRGIGYESGGDVFYSVRAFEEYGKLSRRDVDELRQGVRIDVNEQKKDPLDFALWKAAKPGEPSWESPWGTGRPGWHIECSAMSMKFLGDSFDIHGGGKDLIFPHHENEIAQSEGSTGRPFAKYWLHNGMIEINKEKMSKSLGNIMNIAEALQTWNREVIRFLFLTHQYQNPAEFSQDTMEEAKAGLERLYLTLDRIASQTPSGQPSDGQVEDDALSAAVEKFKESWLEAMCDDFNTAGALGHLFELVKSINKSIDSSGYTAALKEACDEISSLGSVLGILQYEPKRYLQDDKLERGEAGITPEEIERLIEERNKARGQRDWSKADEIRDQLKEKGVVIDDSPQGTQWRFSQ